MPLGERLKALRNQIGFSQEMVAERVGVSRQAVTKWESGQTIPTGENLAALAELYAISLDEGKRWGGQPYPAGKQNCNGYFCPTGRTLCLCLDITGYAAWRAAWGRLPFAPVRKYRDVGTVLYVDGVEPVL